VTTGNFTMALVPVAIAPVITALIALFVACRPLTNQ
jgi:hypothetical protein